MLTVGSQLGAYDLVAALKDGGMAHLFLGVRRGPAGFHHHVVIKAVKGHLAAHDEFVRMFLDEARIAARIQHPNVVRIEELGQHEGTYFLVMEHVHGAALSEILAVLAENNRRLSPELSVRILRGAAAGLHAAHETTDGNGHPLGVVHRDVSPQNVLVGLRGEVKVIDFGIAKARNRLHVTAAGAGLKGKLRYMAPEQLLRADTDRRADVYSLGVLAWEMLTMRRLFQGKSDVEVMERIRKGGFPPPGAFVTLPHALDEAIMAALARDPNDRPPTADAFRLMLRDALPSASAVEGEDIGQLLWALRGRAIEERGVYLDSKLQRPPVARVQAVYEQLTQPAAEEFADASTMPVHSMQPRFAPDDALFSAPEYVVEAEEGSVAVATLYEVLDDNERTHLREKTPAFLKATPKRVVGPPSTPPAGALPPAGHGMVTGPMPMSAFDGLVPAPPPTPDAPSATAPGANQKTRAPSQTMLYLGVALLGLLAGAVIVLATLLALSDG